MKLTTVFCLKQARKIFFAVGAIAMIAAGAGVFATGTSAPNCPLQPQSGRTLIYFGSGFVRSDDDLSDATKGPFSVSLSQGSYDVTLVSFDNHSSKSNQVQPNEQWFLILKNSQGSQITQTNAISDLPDNQNTLVEKVNSNFAVSGVVSSVTVRHAAYPNSNPNSITPVCAAFDKLLDPEPKKCVLTIAKTVDRPSAEPGDTVTYGLSFMNIGTADCTGGGVKITDTLSGALEFLSETHSSNVSAGYSPLPLHQNGLLLWNAHTLTPGESGTVTFRVRVKDSGVCGMQTSVINIVKITSAEYGNSDGVTSNSVSTNVSKPCPPPPDPDPTADIKANGSDGPITIPHNSSALISWNSANANSCTVAPTGWAGISGVNPTGNLTASKTYTLTCVRNAKTASDTVTVNVETRSLPTASIVANPSTIIKGGSSILTWSSTNADTCFASGGWSGTKSLSGSLSVSPLQNTTYSIKCINTAGDATDSATVTVIIPDPVLPTVTIVANPPSIVQGNSSILTWSSTNADSCVATGGWSGSRGFSGSMSVSPSQTTIYTITCSNSHGTDADTATVGVLPKEEPIPTADIKANGSDNSVTIQSGTAANISWTSVNTNSCTVASGGWTGTSGSQSTGNLFGTQTYTVNCTGSGGSASDSVTVFIQQNQQVPTADIKANGSDSSVTVSYGNSAVISWSSTNASSCSVSPNNWTGISGSQSSNAVFNTQTYTVNCTGSGGSASDSVTVFTNQNSNPPTITLTGNPATVSRGQIATLFWTSSNAISCNATGGWSGGKALSGSETVTPFIPQTYTITCHNAQGQQASAQAFINVFDQTPTVNLSSAPQTISRGETAVLVWNSTNATQCFGSGGWSGVKSLSGSETVSPQFNTVYTITCNNNTGSAFDSDTVNVIAPPVVQSFSVACATGVTTASTGNSVTFAAGHTGGIEPVVFSWSGDISGSGQARTVSFSTTGTKVARVLATDARGIQRDAACSITVVSPAVITPPPPPPTILGVATEPPSCNCCCGGNIIDEGSVLFKVSKARIMQLLSGDESGGATVSGAHTDAVKNASAASLFAASDGSPSSFLYFILLALFALVALFVVADMITSRRAPTPRKAKSDDAYRMNLGPLPR